MRLLSPPSSRVFREVMFSRPAGVELLDQAPSRSLDRRALSRMLTRFIVCEWEWEEQCHSTGKLGGAGSSASGHRVMVDHL